METRLTAEALAALAQETRLDLIRLLVVQGAAGLPAGALAERLGVPPSTLSFHLNALERAGLLHSTRQGRSIVYAVRIGGLRALLAFLAETCGGGRPDLGGDLARLQPDERDDGGATAPAFNVLFLCTHNSARSIMAEAILNRVGRGRFRAWSAGSRPARRPLPQVIAMLSALGHDVSRLASKRWDSFTGAAAPRMDFVIALCDTLDLRACPDLGERALTAAWPLPDPKKFAGSPAQRATLLNELYAGLGRRIGVFTGLPFARLDRIALQARLDQIGGFTHA
jgi:protein-tyrosine-phosphatase/DNA-binding transcriptional ArsR family regulator